MNKRGKQLTRLNQRCLQHVGKQGQDRVQGLELAAFGSLAVLDTSEELSEDGQIQDQGSGEKRVLYVDMFVSYSTSTERVKKRKRTSHSLKMLMVERPPQKISE